MIHLTRALIRRWLDALLHIDDSPERTAAAFALGVYSNLPLIIAPYYAFVTMTAANVAGHKPPPGFNARLTGLFESSLFHSEFWHQLWGMLRPFLWPYMVGSTMGALVLAAIAYPLALGFVTSRRRIHEMIQHHHHHS